MAVRANIIAAGRVQKVGYRDLVQDAARKLDITGYVKNLPDGTVKVVCEGKKNAIEELIKQIKVKQDFIYVDEIRTTFTKQAKKFKVFSIRYGTVQEELGERMGSGILYIRQMSNELSSFSRETKQALHRCPQSMARSTKI